MSVAKLNWMYSGLAVLGGVVVLFFTLGGFLLDDLRIAPHFGFRMEWAKSVQRRVKVDSNKYQCDLIEYQVEEGGAGGGGVSVALFRKGKRLLEVGGDETAFVGFRDVDGDGIKEVLVTCRSRWSEKGVWKGSDSGFAKIGANRQARIILGTASVLAHGPLGVLGGVLLMITAAGGVLGCRRRSRLQVLKTQQELR